jgi:hypothetical protein
MPQMNRDRFAVENTDEWWFKRLFDTYFERSKRRGVTKNRVEWAEHLWRWYIGDPELPDHATDWQQQITQDVLRMGRANLAQLAVESKLERVQLRAFRTVTESDDEDTTGPDATARKLMAKYTTAFDDASLFASVMNDGYIWIGGKGDDGLPTVTAEDPRNCVTIDDPVDPYKAIAAMKLYHDKILGYDYAHVVLPKTRYTNEDTDETTELGTRIRVARRKSGTGTVSPTFRPGAWEWDDDNKSAEYPSSVQNRGTLVHHVQAPNGVGDIEPHIDVLMRINNMIVDRLWISKFQVFRQRAIEDQITDADAEDPMPDEDPDTGEKIDWDEVFQADPGAVWRLPAGVRIWESTPTDLQGALLSVRDDIKEFAASSRTPIYVFVPDAVTGSAEGASLADRAAVGKAEKWQKRLQRPFHGAASDMLAVAGETVTELELVWGPAKKESVNAQTSSAAQAKTAGVPQEGVWETYLQADPETVRRWKSMRRRDLLFQAPGEPPKRPDDVPVEDDGQPPTRKPDEVDEFANRPPARPAPRPREGAVV